MTGDVAPEVRDADVTLRPIEPRDADAWFAYLSLPHVVEHTSWNVRRVDDLRTLIDACGSGLDGDSIRFAIVDRTGSLAGTIGLPAISQVNRTAEVAYDIDPAHAKRGLATACCRAVTEWLLGEHGFVRVQATALDTNLASQRVLAKSGFVVEGKLRNLKLVRGEPRDFFLVARTTR